MVQSIFSISGGLYISKFGRYGEVIWFGFGIWTLGAGLLVLSDRTISLGLVSLFLVFIGMGTGCTFQPTLVALQAHCPKSQRAVVTSNRNFIRSSGGAVGLAVSSAILSNVLRASLPSGLESIASNTFAIPDLSTFSTVDRDAIIDAYADASRAVFIWCVPVSGLAFLLTAFIKDKGLVRKEEQAQSTEAAGVISPKEIEEGGQLTSSEYEKDAEAKEAAVDVIGSGDNSRKPSVSSRRSGEAI